MNPKQVPGRVEWTPLRQACGCVIDWGWSGETGSPQAFISWCARMVETSCPRHGQSSPPALSTPGITIDVEDPQTRARFRARLATGADVALGEQLAGELIDLRDRVTDNPLSVLAGIPANYRNWLRRSGYDPLQAWMDQRLTDIVCNRGRQTLTPELLASIPDQPGLDCERCAFSARTGGILCACGHDWSCHPTAARGLEPCSHCGCQDMKTSGGPS